MAHSYPNPNVNNLNQLGSNRDRENGGQSWMYPVSDTDQSYAWNNVQPNPLCQIPIFNGTNYPTADGCIVPEIPYTSAPYTGFDPHTLAAIPSGHIHMNIQPYNGGYIQSRGQTTSQGYPDQQIPRRHGDVLKWKCSWKDCTTLFGKEASMVRHVKTLHIERGAFPCPLCGHPSNRRDNLRNHITTVHRIPAY
ncbi:Zinc finger C2H2 [Penicillium cf. griseofulvum]|uniref:Zinc finger C2H2 n=1 Tax=Penicillium cf. griseofulvum TaxID=2972120 RepID=A0A9W9MRB0_9EURO|nr:Zinc finger C2H2 [Penicillium cf. griseofulvum]KAJ5440920.1 Zinc finger C2H2 [Penicillium cf. griseofulvum]KAJ5448965.1 Zinc finger C2H2 [Penicillium cf. griseofulvum]